MRKVIAAVMVSLDGVMQAPGGPTEDPSGGFKFGGWIPPYSNDESGEVVGELFSRPFELLLGRRTYDIFAAFWPGMEGPEGADADPQDAGIAKALNHAVKHVATHHPDGLTWENSHALGADVPAAVRELKAKEGPDLLVQGSTELLHQLFAAGLVDRLILTIAPIVLGDGKRLWGEGAQPHAFRLTDSRTTDLGVVIASYDLAGEVPTGSFLTDHPSEAELERRRTWPK